MVGMFNFNFNLANATRKRVLGLGVCLFETTSCLRDYGSHLYLLTHCSLLGNSPANKGRGVPLGFDMSIEQRSSSSHVSRTAYLPSVGAGGPRSCIRQWAPQCASRVFDVP